MGAPLGAPMGAPVGTPMGAPTGPATGASPDQMASQFGQMNIGGQQAPQFQQHMQQPQMQQQPPAMHQVQMNQLQPTDLISQPFNVYELDLPPPQINLPPNVSFVGIYDRVSISNWP